MATVELQAKVNGPTKQCIRCKRFPVSGLKCKKCDSLSHPGCIKHLQGVKFLNTETIICCEPESNLNTDKDTPEQSEAGEDETRITDPITISAQAEDIEHNEIRYLKEIIIQKDCIIENQKIAINALQGQVCLLQQNLEFCKLSKITTSCGQATRHIDAAVEGRQPTPQGSSQVTNDNSQSNKNKKNEVNFGTFEKKKHNNKNNNKKRNNSNNFTSDQVANAIKDAIKVQKPQTEDDENELASSNLEGWKTVDYRKKKHTNLTGSGTTTFFEAAEKQMWLYVGRTKPNTTVQMIINHLNHHFPNNIFSAEEIKKHENNKCPNKAFKIGADFALRDVLLQKEYWPANTIINRYKFFRANRNQNNEK